MAEEKKGLFQRLKEGLSKTHKGLVDKVDQAILGRKKIDEGLYDELEEILVTSDLGVQTSYKLIERVRERLRRGESDDAALVKKYLKEEILSILKGTGSGIDTRRAKPFVIMVVGVNGVGKTTTIGKLASRYRGEGRSVLLSAGDTFRAAAVEQLEVWGERSGCGVIKHKEGSDPSAVLFDALKAAQGRGTDILIADTAGRLHTKTNLMEELKKTRRVVEREAPGAPHEVLLVLDATTGQNAVSQAKLFKEAVEITGIVLTKLDGTAKGGVVISIVDELKIPVKFIGIGEGVEDLRPFEPSEFVEALF
ncbi:MAG: signal recognition particle-docking protein FtsY [Deltaproteobacteria bacterium]|nr:signal recognition particle-docking protein FtsY [Deltaproteobacteria bacterium]